MNSKLQTENLKHIRTLEDPIPAITKPWSLLYAMILVELAILIGLFYLFMKVFE